MIYPLIRLGKMFDQISQTVRESGGRYGVPSNNHDATTMDLIAATYTAYPGDARDIPIHLRCKGKPAQTASRSEAVFFCIICWSSVTAPILQGPQQGLRFVHLLLELKHVSLGDLDALLHPLKSYSEDERYLLFSRIAFRRPAKNGAG